MADLELSSQTKSLASIQLAGCLIIDKSGKVLLLHRNTPKRSQWETPGGKIEPREEARIAARREAMEELGVKVEVGVLLGNRGFKEDDVEYSYAWYEASILSGTPVPNEEKFNKVKYFSWDELSQIRDQLSNNTRNLVDAYLAGEIRLPESSS